MNPFSKLLTCHYFTKSQAMNLSKTKINSHIKCKWNSDSWETVQAIQSKRLETNLSLPAPSGKASCMKKPTQLEEHAGGKVTYLQQGVQGVLQKKGILKHGTLPSSPLAWLFHRPTGKEYYKPPGEPKWTAKQKVGHQPSISKPVCQHKHIKPTWPPSCVLQERQKAVRTTVSPVSPKWPDCLRTLQSEFWKTLWITAVAKPGLKADNVDPFTGWFHQLETQNCPDF